MTDPAYPEEMAEIHVEMLRPWLRHRTAACRCRHPDDPCECGMDHALSRLRAALEAAEARQVPEEDIATRIEAASDEWDAPESMADSDWERCKRSTRGEWIAYRLIPTEETDRD